LCGVRIRNRLDTILLLLLLAALGDHKQHAISPFVNASLNAGTNWYNGGTAKFKTSTLASGTHSITVTYNGSTRFDGSSASLTQTVN
jgi:hypothetical protein